MTTPETEEPWWADLEKDEEESVVVADIPDIDGDICSDGSIMKTIKKSGSGSVMPKKGDKVRCHYVGMITRHNKLTRIDEYPPNSKVLFG